MSRAPAAAERLPDPVRTVLLALGDADSRAMYRAMLQSRSYAIEDCDDGAEALGRAIAGKADVVIASVRLARIDGLALCRLLRSDPLTRASKIVLLTTTAQPGEAVRAKAAGADVILEAPCTPEALIDALRELETDARGAAPASPAACPEPMPDARRQTRARSLRREQTTSPPLQPPALHCPGCQLPLTYEHSQTGGVNESAFEQWDYFKCETCGPFQYRHRTRKLRAT